MKFQQITPDKPLHDLIECYWIIEDDESTPARQKIIPDGFPEIIFHYRDPYRINIKGTWELQSRDLLAGQLKKHFFLENTGQSEMIGIKFKPTSIAHLFGLNMKQFTDKVVPLSTIDNAALSELRRLMSTINRPEDAIDLLDNLLAGLMANASIKRNKADEAIDLIVQSHGTIGITELCRELKLGERMLQMLFQQYVGLSPKFYSRITRFNYIFQLMKEGNPSWCDVTYTAGFFDQAHFIKNFESFTGESPSSYGFQTENIANFFLNRPK